jgi:hypothetical protein
MFGKLFAQRGFSAILLFIRAHSKKKWNLKKYQQTIYIFTVFPVFHHPPQKK